jgi:aspartate carbamoyltransferase catalytic subunit
MSGWHHRHILDLASFSRDDFASILELAQRFRSLPVTGVRKLPALQGRLVATLFFEPSTRTRSSFELAAKRLSADVMSFSPSSSSLSKGESVLDTARTYVAMGADVLVVRHRSTSVPQQLAADLDRLGERTVVLNGGDGLHSHPSQGLLDLLTLARHFDAQKPTPQALAGKKNRDCWRHPAFSCGPLQSLGTHWLWRRCGSVWTQKFVARGFCCVC